MNAHREQNRRARPARLLACALAALLLAACGGDTELANKEFDAPEANANVKRGVAPEPDSEVAVIEMAEPGYGRIVIEFYPNVAPKMVERFKTLAREGFYNGTAFHRVEPASNVIQGGDPLSKDDNPDNDGTGGSPYPNVPSEASDLPYEPGSVGAADSGLGTANSQFFITLGRMPQWEERYTVFGKVIDGLNNARVISGAPVIPGTTKPSPKVVIKSVTLQPRASFQK
ncbi:MAG TPA: peptidylprolyl isomerase [Pyrinomonadaceae bacterium]|nr:peptidylprolyl isomerase [Pyrinomonadaceae bacterium]